MVHYIRNQLTICLISNTCFFANIRKNRSIKKRENFSDWQVTRQVLNLIFLFFSFVFMSNELEHTLFLEHNKF